MALSNKLIEENMKKYITATALTPPTLPPPTYVGIS